MTDAPKFVVTPITPETIAKGPIEVAIKIDLDERAFIFPQHKPLTHLTLRVVRPSLVKIEAGYAFNQSRSSPELFSLTHEDCAEFSRRLLEAVYRARSTEIVTRTLSVTLVVAANGYILNINEKDRQIELFLGLASIWRVCSGFARAVDMMAPIQSN